MFHVLRKKRINLVFTVHFWLKRLCGINNDKNDNKYITQIQEKTTNATQDKIEFEK